MDIIDNGGLFPLVLRKGGISGMSRPFKDNGEMKEVGNMRVFPANEKYVDTVVELLNRGEVLLGPFDTTYGLFASIKRPDAIKRIYTMKRRSDDMPLTMIVPKDRFSQYAEIPERVRKLLSKELDGPISIILPKKKDKVPDHVTSGLPTVSLADGENAFMKRVMERIEICGTSANIHGEAPPSTLSGALAQLGDSVTLAVDGGPTLYKIGHTVLDLASDPPKLIRAGPFDTKKIFALFPELVAARSDPIPDDLVKGSSVVDLTPKVEVRASRKGA
jgi:L-threonylcarbamoyladenylate synthase